MSGAIGGFIIGESPIGGGYPVIPAGSSWPPTGPSSITQTIPAYVYEQYADDDSIQALFDAYNQITQQYLNWFTQTPLAVYTDPSIAGPLLDWVALGVYGIRRPSLPYGAIQSIGPLDTWMLNSITLNTVQQTGAVNYFVTSDDIFKRIITWFFFKGDEQDFSVLWLKRRVMRFLIGTAGTAPNIDETYPVSVAFGVDNLVIITITITPGGEIDPSVAQVFQAAVQDGVLELPFQFQFSVSIVNAVTNLYSDNGLLGVLPAAAYPSAGGLGPGSIYSNGGAVSVVTGVTPNPIATPVFFGFITASQLLSLGGGNLPHSGVTPGSGQLWNPGGLGEIWVA